MNEPNTVRHMLAPGERLYVEGAALVEPVCATCHGRKTVREDGGFGREGVGTENVTRIIVEVQSGRPSSVVSRGDRPSLQPEALEIDAPEPDDPLHTPGAPTPQRAAKIIDCVCQTADVDYHDMISTTRAPRVVEARRVAVVLLRARTVMSYPEIARAMRRRSHSTVMALAASYSDERHGELLRRVEEALAA